MTERIIFGGTAWPLGWSVGFLRSTFEHARDATLGWYRQINKKTRVNEPGLPSLLDLLLELDPLQTPSKRELLVATASGWTAHFMNDHLGGDSVSWVGHLSGVLGCDGVITTHIPVDQYAYPATQFELVGPDGPPPLRYVRTISCGKFDSGKWVFSTRGKVQPFEEPTSYAFNPVRNRFDRPMLIKYLAALDIRPDDPFFWGPAASLLETVADWKSRESTLVETRRDYGARERSV